MLQNKLGVKSQYSTIFIDSRQTIAIRRHNRTFCVTRVTMKRNLGFYAAFTERNLRKIAIFQPAAEHNVAL